MMKRLLYNKLFQNAGVYTISNIINASIPFLLLPVLTRYLTTHDYGITATFQSLVGFFIPFTGLNTQGAVTRRYYDGDKVDFPVYVSTCLIILLFSTLVLVSILLPFSSFLSRLTEFPRQWLWAIIAVAFFQQLYTIMLGIWQVRGKVYQYAIFQNSQTLLNISASLFLVISLRMNWEGRIIGQTVSIVVYGILALVLIDRMGFLKKKISKAYLRDALKFGLPLLPYNFTGWILLSMDRIFLNNMQGLDETGLYSVAYQICMVITLFQLSFNNAWVPWIYEKIKLKDRKLDSKIVKFSYGFILFNFLLALLLAFVGPAFFKIFLGKNFFQASSYLLWLALAQAANSIHIITVSYIFFHNKNIYLTYSALFTTLIHIPVTYFMIKHNGTIGAAQSLFISNMLTSLLTFIFAARFHKLPWVLKKP